MPPAKPSKEEMAKTIDSFSPLEVFGPEVLDRSTLEQWATCPMQARLIATGKVNHFSAIANSGEEVHVAFSEALKAYLGSHGQMSPAELADEARNNLRMARPDVQPDAIRGAQRAVYDWAKFISAKAPSSFMAFDGGEGDLCGQLSWDAGGVIVTSELDLLTSGPGSPELVYLDDYKTGHKMHSAADVANSFQFQLHAVLVFENFEAVQAVSVSVWNTRTNRRTYRHQFERRDSDSFKGRISGALSQYYNYNHLPIERVPTWPEQVKCSFCDACQACPLPFTGQPEDSPEQMVDRLVVLEESTSRIKKTLNKLVDETGLDILTANGNAYGTRKPKERKPTKSIYKPISNEEPEDGQDDGTAD